VTGTTEKELFIYISREIALSKSHAAAAAARVADHRSFVAPEKLSSTREKNHFHGKKETDSEK